MRSPAVLAPTMTPFPFLSGVCVAGALKGDAQWLVPKGTFCRSLTHTHTHTHTHPKGHSPALSHTHHYTHTHTHTHTHSQVHHFSSSEPSRRNPHKKHTYTLTYYYQDVCKVNMIFLNPHTNTQGPRHSYTQKMLIYALSIELDINNKYNM